MSKRRDRCRGANAAGRRLAVGVLVALCFAAILVTPLAQPAFSGKVSGGFKAPGTTDPEGRRHLVQGKDMESRGNNLLELTEPRVTRYNPDDTADMFIESPRCFYQTKASVAYSATNLVVKTADARYQIEGVGWKWDLSDSVLTISNQVVALVQKAALSSTVNANTTNARPATGSIRITSDRFQQEGDAASFLGNVLVLDGEDRVQCERLNIQFVKPGGAQQIEALQNVDIQQADTRIRSGKAVYQVKENLIRISENPTWVANAREGSADLLVMNRMANTLAADGHVYMKLPVTNLLFAAENTDTNAPTTNRFVEIRSEKFSYDNPLTNRPARAVYQGKVSATQADSTLLCLQLVAHFGESNRLSQLHAEQEVQIKTETSKVFGTKADYNLDADKLVVTGDPRWEMKDGQGKGETLVFYPKKREMLAIKNVETIVAGHSLGALFSTNASSAEAPGTNTLKITAQSLSHSEQVSLFQNDVLVTDARGTIGCETLTLFSGGTNQMQRIIAEKSVVIRQPDMVALGDRAEYDQTTGLIRLTGSPELISPGRRLRADVFFIDRNRNTFSVSPGKFHIELQMEKGKKAVSSK